MAEQVAADAEPKPNNTSVPVTEKESLSALFFAVSRISSLGTCSHVAGMV